MTIKELLDLWQSRFAVYFLLVIAFGSLIFTPITFICVMFWLSIFVFSKGEPTEYEKILIVIAVAWIGIIATISPVFNLNFFTTISDLFWTVNLFYLAGIILASFIFIRKMLDVRDITISKIKEELKKAKIEEGKEPKEE